MASGTNYVVKNLNHKPCRVCGGDHDYISRKSNHARCGTPVAFSREMAESMAKAEGLPVVEAVIVVPDDTVVILDDSARKLKQQGGGSVPLDQVFGSLRTA